MRFWLTMMLRQERFGPLGDGHANKVKQPARMYVFTIENCSMPRPSGTEKGKRTSHHLPFAFTAN
jgi:hypothetical protein